MGKKPDTSKRHDKQSFRFSFSIMCSVRYLVLLYRGIVFVTHGTDLHAFVPLSVTLGEELHHDAVRPLPVQLQWFGWVAQISTVDHVLQNLGKTCTVRLPWLYCSTSISAHSQYLFVYVYR